MGVQFPSAPPDRAEEVIRNDSSKGPIAQPAEALVSETSQSRFESWSGYQADVVFNGSTFRRLWEPKRDDEAPTRASADSWRAETEHHEHLGRTRAADLFALRLRRQGIPARVVSAGSRLDAILGAAG